MDKTSCINKLTFGEHLNELRKVFVKVALVVLLCMIIVFGFKDFVFKILLWPCESDFKTFNILRSVWSSNIYPDDMELITTDISSQFMAHLSVSFYMGLLLASPYILYEIMLYVTPALYEKEKKYAYKILFSVYLLFFIGIFVSYWILFPVSCRFLASYSISANVKPMISLDSYMSLFISLTILMGVVFQLPILAFSLAKLGIIDHKTMAQYRKHAFILIVVVAALITPPDILTLIIVTFPLYLLYEASIWGLRILCNKKTEEVENLSISIKDGNQNIS